MAEVGDFTLDYPVRVWVPGHWQDEEVSKPRIIYNVGLPRTGTTSVGRALKEMGFEQKLPVHSAIDWHRARFTLGATRWRFPVICTVRERGDWFESVQAYRPEVPLEDLRSIWLQHSFWLRNDVSQAVGMLNVAEGYAGLFHALHRAFDGRYELPHLNQRSRLK